MFTDTSALTVIGIAGFGVHSDVTGAQMLALLLVIMTLVYGYIPPGEREA